MVTRPELHTRYYRKSNRKERVKCLRRLATLEMTDPIAQGGYTDQDHAGLLCRYIVVGAGLMPK